MAGYGHTDKPKWEVLVDEGPAGLKKVDDWEDRVTAQTMMQLLWVNGPRRYQDLIVGEEQRGQRTGRETQQGVKFDCDLW